MKQYRCYILWPLTLEIQELRPTIKPEEGGFIFLNRIDAERRAAAIKFMRSEH